MSDSKFRIGFMSTANICNKNLIAVRETGVADVVAVASRSLEKATAWAKDRNIPKAYGSYEELLQDPEIDAVYIPLPTTMHLEWVTKAAKAKKHVLCEKPTASDAEELAKMIQVTRDNGVLWMDGVMFMHHHRIQLVQQTIKEIGGVNHVLSSFCFSGTAEFLQTNIRMDPNLEPFGALGDLGWYNIRVALMAFDWSAPSQVRADTLVAQTGTTLPLDMNVNIKWADGKSSIFHCSFLHEFQQYVAISGPKGRVVYNDFVIPAHYEHCSFTKYGSSSLDKVHRTVISKHEEIQVDGSCQEREMWRRFVCLGRGQTTTEEGQLGDRDFWQRISLVTQAVLDAAYKSSVTGNGWVDVVVPTVV